MNVLGQLVLDSGAAQALTQQGVSLLAVGITEVQGEFQRGEVVRCLNPEGREIARGMVNYNSRESRQIKGKSSDRIENILGYIDETELIHRDNLVLLPTS